MSDTASNTSENTLEVCTVSECDEYLPDSMSVPDIPVMTDENAHMFDGEGRFIGEQDKYEVMEVDSDADSGCETLDQKYPK